MTQNDLYLNVGFDNEEVNHALLSYYRPYIEENSMRLLGQRDIIDPVSVIKDVLSHLPDYPVMSDMQPLVYHCFRCRMSDFLVANEYSIPPSNKLLLEYAKQLNNHGGTYHIHNDLNAILSFFDRKMFQYFIERYYYFRDEIPFDNRIEKKIQALFAGKGDIRAFRLFTGMQTYPAGSGFYMEYLSELPIHFIEQIGSEEAIIPHASALRYSLLQIHFNAANKSIPIVLFIFAVFTLIMILYVLL